MKGKDNLNFFVYGRNLVIDFIRTTPIDLKAYYTFRSGTDPRRSLHALFVVHFGHNDRHLRQIQRVKQHAKFPR